MNIQKPSIPKGTRDFGPAKMARRNYILDVIKNTYKTFGFQPIETPAMENLSVLTGKYGDEGDQLIFKILNSGNFLEKVTPSFLQEGAKKVLPVISEKALRYDLTVPFARYVVMNRNEITFPFKRYQVQPVWRADRPQKGRYREFFQCDADVIGTNSLLCEAEIVLMIKDVFQKLRLVDYTIKINNRKVLEGITALFGKTTQLSDITIAIDKLDKIGEEGVVSELETKGVDLEVGKSIVSYFTSYSKNYSGIRDKINFLKKDFSDKDIEIGLKGIGEIEEVLNHLNSIDAEDKNLDFDVSLARGLSYYTGAIFEVKVNNVKIGSVCGGGRYDNLTGVFGLPGMSGVGISFGVDRIYDVLEELDLFPTSQLQGTKVLVCVFDKSEVDYGFKILKSLREISIPSEIYPEPLKLKKQLEYADKKSIPFVIIIGKEEIESGTITLKNMLSGEQNRYTLTEVIQQLIV